MDVFTEESRPSAFNGIMQQYSCKGATQVPFFRFFTWKVQTQQRTLSTLYGEKANPAGKWQFKQDPRLDDYFSIEPSQFCLWTYVYIYTYISDVQSQSSLAKPGKSSSIQMFAKPIHNDQFAR
jgi:hypothetical protein